MALVQVRIKHGSVMTSKRTFLVGEVMTLSEADVQSMDPRGEMLEVIPAEAIPAAPVEAAPPPVAPPSPPLFAPVIEAPPSPPAPKKRKKGTP